VKNIILVFLVLLTTVSVGAFGYLVYSETKYIPPTKSTIQGVTSSLTFPKVYKFEPRLFDLPQITPSNVSYNGWIPTWAMNAGIKTLEERKDKFASISPVFYSIQADGSFQSNKGGLDKIKSTIAGTNIKIIPTIGCFDPDGLGKVLNNPDEYHKSLLSEIDQNGYDGIDLDYESTYLNDKDEFFAHLKFLSTELKKRNKILSVTVLSKWADDITYGFAPQTRQVQDYAEIAKYADQIRIMTYDFTSQGSANPGPIAPVEWVEQVLKYATNRVSPNKLVLGIHLYGYFWNATEDKARALDYRTITDIKQNNQNPDSFYSTKNEESALKYIGSNGKAFFGYYAGPEVVQSRVNLAAKYGVSAVSFWRLGDDPL